MDDLSTHDVMASALIERGIITPEAAAADRAALQAQLSGEPAPATAEPATSTAQALSAEGITPQAAHPDADPIEASVWAAPAGITAYDLAQGPAPAGTEPAPEFEAANRAAFFAAGIPQSVGNHIARLWNDTMARGEVPNDAQLEASRRETLAALNKHWGAETQANLARAKTVVQVMAKHQPAIWQMLETSGLGNNAWLIMTLANMARAREPKA